MPLKNNIYHVRDPLQSAHIPKQPAHDYGQWMLGGVIILVFGLTAILSGRGLKFWKFEIAPKKDNSPADTQQAQNQKRELIINVGFQNYIRDSNLVLKEFLSGDVHKYFVSSFVDLLKNKGVDTTNIRHNIDVIRYENLFGLSMRKIVIPRFFTIFFRNHIPIRSDLNSHDERKRENAKHWYRAKMRDVIGDVHEFMLSNWGIGVVTADETKRHYEGDMDGTIYNSLVSCFERVRVKRELIFGDMLEEIPDQSPVIIRKRWEELFILLGYNDILE